MDVLLTFTGFHDPFSKGLIGEEEQPGPILSLLAERPFGKVYLFSTPATQGISEDTKQAIAGLNQAIKVEVLAVSLDDPTDYQQILSGLRRLLHNIQDSNPYASFHIAVASGTPQMHACWMLLAAAGEIPARILNVRPPKFVTKERPLVEEIDLTSPAFPVIRFEQREPPALPGIETDIELAIRQSGIVGDHPSICRAIEIAAMLAPSHAPVLIQGETGTGKEVFSRLIHRLSGRPKEVFEVVNCAAIPNELAESILFGHKRGAFTGALSDQLGKFDVANRGTLFLDELGDLPPSSQAKLLRVLQDGMVEPVGATVPHRVDVRIIAATNQDLRQLVGQGRFREDLFYRLNVGELRLPPLRERRSDIPRLALHTLDRINRSLRAPKRLSPRALSRLQAHSWPGNVRDMENVIERSVRLCRSDILEDDDLLITEPVGYADPLKGLPEPQEGFSLDEFIGSARRQLILRALKASDGNQSRAARLLGVSPQAVHKFIRQSKPGP